MSGKKSTDVALDYIISACENVPENPASGFREAVQSLWFAHIANTWEDYINANSLGRLDQILYPYYKADIEKGVPFFFNDDVMIPALASKGIALKDAYDYTQI